MESDSSQRPYGVVRFHSISKDCSRQCLPICFQISILLWSALVLLCSQCCELSCFAIAQGPKSLFWPLGQAGDTMTVTPFPFGRRGCWYPQSLKLSLAVKECVLYLPLFHNSTFIRLFTSTVVRQLYLNRIERSLALVQCYHGQWFISATCRSSI